MKLVRLVNKELDKRCANIKQFAHPTLASHRGTHTDDYYRGLNTRLRDANKGPNAGDNVRGVLKEYQKNLQGK
jgi:hypothetical protein